MAYPDEIGDIGNTPAGSSTLGGSSPTHVQHHQQLHAAIDSIADVLGDDPAVGHASVEDALTAISTGVDIDEETDSFTLAAAQAGKRIACNKSSTLTVTVPANASVPIAVGQMFELVAMGTGTVTVAAGGGVTILSLDSNLSLAGQYASAVLVKHATNTWVLTGALA